MGSFDAIANGHPSLLPAAAIFGFITAVLLIAFLAAHLVDLRGRDDLSM